MRGDKDEHHRLYQAGSRHQRHQDRPGEGNAHQGRGSEHHQPRGQARSGGVPPHQGERGRNRNGPDNGTATGQGGPQRGNGNGRRQGDPPHGPRLRGRRHLGDILRPGQGDPEARRLRHPLHGQAGHRRRHGPDRPPDRRLPRPPAGNLLPEGRGPGRQAPRRTGAGGRLRGHRDAYARIAYRHRTPEHSQIPLDQGHRDSLQGEGDRAVDRSRCGGRDREDRPERLPNNGQEDLRPRRRTRRRDPRRLQRGEGRRTDRQTSRQEHHKGLIS